MTVIYTDASYSHDYKVGAYAFRIIVENIVLSATGPLKKCDSAHQAEMMCISNALHFLSQVYPNEKTVTVYSDSKIAIHRKPKHPGVSVTYWHTKAHTPTTDPHNKWCDMEARKTLRENVAVRKAAL